MLSGENSLLRLHLRQLHGHHPLNDVEVCEVAGCRYLVLGSYFSELRPEIVGVEGLAGLIVHESDDLVTHGVIVIRVITLSQVNLHWQVTLEPLYTLYIKKSIL